MPCQDQTENLMLLLDAEERIANYQLVKQTCGRTVGGDVLLPYVHGMSVEALLAAEIQDVVMDIASMPDVEEFLLYKQFFALRAACGVLTGQRSGEPGTAFALDELCFEADSTHLTGIIAVDLISKEIRACGSCGSCAPKKRKARAEQKQLDQFLDDLLRTQASA